MQVISVDANDPRVGSLPEVKAAVLMNTPRVGWCDHFMSVASAINNMGLIPIKTGGAYWAQAMHYGFKLAAETEIDWLICVDYDSIFNTKHLENLMDLAAAHPEADAIVCNQARRESPIPLVSLDGSMMEQDYDRSIFDQELTEIVTGHFGLTLVKMEALKRVRFPWFYCQPAGDGDWDLKKGSIDADVWFWLQFRKFGGHIYHANQIRIGHLQNIITWVLPNGELAHQYIGEYEKYGAPKEVNPKHAERLNYANPVPTVQSKTEPKPKRGRPKKVKP